jgi:2-keto-4-pentenoate hydratase
MDLRRAALLLVMLLPAVCPAADPAALGAAGAAARRAGGPWPLVHEHGVDTPEEAYAVQRAALAGLGLVPQGFKAGLTTPGAQARFGLAEPVLGVLGADMRLAPEAPVSLREFQRARFELEIAFILAAPITARVERVEDLRALVLAVAPALEIPDLAFADPEAVRGVDLIAANVGAARYRLGQERRPEGLDLASVNPVLRRDGNEILRGRSADALGDPWESLRWMVNRAQELGHRPQRGAVLLTGALGGMAPAEPGLHVADFGVLGGFSFRVR